MDYFALGKRIRKRRVEQGMTQEQLAQQVGVTTSFIGHLERGSRKASLETLVALANALHPQIAVPTHYGSIVGAMTDGDDFAAQLAPDIRCVKLI